MTNNDDLKSLLLKECNRTVSEKYHLITSKIRDIQNALESETKSTAGDKHETGRAMLQLEREKLGNQLAEIELSQSVLNKINLSKAQNLVGLGSVVLTSQLNYFISISCGKITIDGSVFYAVSSVSPIAKLLLGKSVKDTFLFRGTLITIHKIL